MINSYSILTHLWFGLLGSFFSDQKHQRLVLVRVVFRYHRTKKKLTKK